MYYPHGWKARINGQQASIVNVNYVLRGVQVPAGKSKVEFRFEPEVIARGTALRWGSLIAFILLLGGLYYVQFRSQNQIA